MKRIIISLLLISSVSQAQTKLPAVTLANDAKINYSLIPTFQSHISNELKRSQIHNQIDKSKVDPNPVRAVGPDTSERFSEGTGTRGGGSGVLFAASSKVQLLDLYRSERLSRYPLFFELDPEFSNQGQGLPVHEGALRIYNLVLTRMAKIFPAMAARVSTAHQNLSFKNWVPAASRLPLIDDYIEELDQNPNEEHVQIAYRRNNQVIYNEELFDKMDALNRAALWLHEELYASASSSNSIQIQRLVSLLFSRRLEDSDFTSRAREILFDLKLNGTFDGLESLPRGVTVNQEEPGSEETCGTINQLAIKPGNQGLLVSLAVDPNLKNLTRENIQNRKGQPDIRELSVDGDAMRVLMISLYIAKAHLSAQFPIYLYPAQNTAPDILCYKDWKKVITRLDMGVLYNQEKNKLELESSALEANYFRVQRNLVLGYSNIETRLENSLLKLEVERSLLDNNMRAHQANTDQAIQNLRRLLSPNSADAVEPLSHLGSVRLKFASPE